MALEIDPPRRDLRKASRPRVAQMRALWRVSAWGGAAVLALAAVAATTQTEIGGERLKFALNPLAEPARAVAELPRRQPESDTETRALEDQVRRLAADRDRITTRLSSIERHLDDVTGSIQRQAQSPAPAPPPVPQPTPAPVASSPAAAPQPASPAPPAAQDASGPSITAATVTTAPAREAAYQLPPVIDPLAVPPGSEGEGWWPVTEVTLEAAPPLTETREIAPLPPTRLATTPPTRLAATPVTRLATLPANAHHTPLQPVGQRYEFGIELAAAPDLETLRTQWSAVKANYGPLLAGLQPIALRDTRPGSKRVRLIAGPMPNLVAARQACTRLVAARAACRPARFTAAAVIQQ